jgi:hypothetical protein
MIDLPAIDVLEALGPIDALELARRGHDREQAVELDLASIVVREVADSDATVTHAAVFEWSSPNVTDLRLAGLFIDTVAYDLVDVTALVMLPLGADRELALGFLDAAPEFHEGRPDNLIGHG